MNNDTKDKGKSVIDRSNHDKKAGRDISKEPETKELKRMICTGELDQDSTVDHLEESGESEED